MSTEEGPRSRRTGRLDGPDDEVPTSGEPSTTGKQPATTLTLVDRDRDDEADEIGLRRAFLAHGGELFGFARRSLDDSSAAEEAVQETFARAWRARHRFDPNLGNLRTWLFAIERNVVIDLARARSMRRTEPLVEDVPAKNDDLESAMVGWQVEEAVRRLRPEHRHVLLETYYRGRLSREVASDLGIPEGTVRSRLFYALRSLRLALEEMGWEG
ncbi:MAG: sigma-70 family RNA polymerase sigma factor [Acidimicrobiales bacterium]